MVKKSIWTFLFVLAFVGAALLFTSRTVTAARYIPVLAYHFVDTAENLPAPGDPYYGYYVTPEQFENHLDIIQAYGYTTITLADLAAYMDGQPVTLPTKPVVITFDDGHQGVYQYAYPALKERGMTATFYIITNYVKDLNAERCVDPNWDGQPSCQVIWDEVELMAADGFEIGSHSSTHPYNLNSDFNNDSSGTVQLELVDSKEAIEAHIPSYTVSTFAYPHGSGSNNAALRTALHDAGYTGAVAFGNEVEDNRVDPAVDNVFALRRLNVDTCHTNELDVNNPWCFFVMRLDPYFPYPSPDIHDVIVTDSNGDSRTTFFPGEDVYVTVQVDNWDAPVNVKAQLSLNNANGIMYDSHPTEDQSAIPLRNDITNEFVDYHWIVPDNPAIIGNYAYAFRVMDLPFAMQYYRYSTTTTLFEISEKDPAFTLGTNAIGVNEDSGLYSVSNWAGDIDAGLPTYPSQTLFFDISGTNPVLFSQQPQINASGDLSFIPQADANGTTQITVALQVRDATNTVVRSTATQTFNITINAINDAPSFTAGVDVSVNEDSGEQIFSDWASAISAGPVDESSQVVAFSLSGYDAGLFDVPPAINASGTLSFTALENVYGSTTISVVLGDDGGTANGGVNTSSAQILTISLNPVNDAPSFSAGSNVEVNEDSATQTLSGWATAISAGPANESSQVVHFNLSGYDAGLFNGQPAISASGDLAFNPAADVNGSTTLIVALIDDGGTANGGNDTSATQTFVITIQPVNDAPSFTAGVDVSVNEDSGEQIFSDWATAISAGPVDESGQVVTFSLSGYDAGLFDVPPAISASGTLSFTALENVYGSTTVSVVLGDDGGTANGGVNTSSAQILTISLNPVNDVPSFTAGSNVEVNEDSATQTLSGWATAISAGPANESSQVVHFNLSGYDAGLFSEAPAVNPGGDLTFKPAENANGSTTITITLGDDGGTANGGNDTSATQTFVITILPVNDVPSFNKGANVVVNEDSTLQTLSGWATAISAGPADESSQPLSFETETSQPELFSSLPGVSAINGNLVFTPAENANGTATVTVRLFDGDLYSAPQTFTITISAFNDAPVANGDSYGMAASQSRLLVVSAPGVLSNDQDIDGNILTVELVSTVTHGSLNLNADGSFTYTSTIGFTGTDQFTYRVWDGMAFSESAIVNITVPFIWIEIYLPMIFRF